MVSAVTLLCYVLFTQSSILVVRMSFVKSLPNAHSNACTNFIVPESFQNYLFIPSSLTCLRYSLKL